MEDVDRFTEYWIRDFFVVNFCDFGGGCELLVKDDGPFEF